jgi:hypothetical protein
MTLKSSYRQSRLAPRCRLFASWSCRRFQGYGCSPFKAERELGLERCKTVWSLSALVVKEMKRFVFSTRGPKQHNHLCTSFTKKSGSYVILI